MIVVERPGARTTVQDLGRAGLGSFGVAPSGAMDQHAFRAANLLVANPLDAAALEATLIGPRLAFERDAIIALTGAAFDATIDGEPIPYAEAVRARAGAVLDVGRARGGARCIIAVRGGIDAPKTLGSRSLHVAGTLGPRALRGGDTLSIGGHDPSAPLRRMPGMTWRCPDRFRVVRGPQWGLFDGEALFGSAYTVSTEADRTGVRFEGGRLRARTHDIDPEGTTSGALQVPGDGYPIALGPDRPITGGYPKIASIIAADRGLLAYARPGDTVAFDMVTVDTARALSAEKQRDLVRRIEEIA